MRRWAFLLRPSWLALAAVVVAFTYLCLTVLAPWQLGKNSSNAQENRQLETSLHAEPVEVTTFLPDQDSAAPEGRWRPVTATGSYLPDAQVLVRMRVLDGAPGFEVLTPFRVDGGPTVLVNRGYVRPKEGSAVPPIPSPPTDRVHITARLRDSEQPAADRNPFEDGGFTQVYSISTAQVTELTGVPLTGSYLQLTAGQPGALSVLSPPNADAGPFLSYGIQWIAFGVIAPLLLGYFAFSELQARRRERAAAEPTAQADTPAPAPTTDGQVPSPVDREMTVEEKLADRYGRRR